MLVSVALQANFAASYTLCIGDGWLEQRAWAFLEPLPL